jgi:hypothetical protein
MKGKRAKKPALTVFSFDGNDIDADLFLAIRSLRVAEFAVRGIAEQAQHSQVEPDDAEAVSEFIGDVRREFEEIKEAIGSADDGRAE